MNGSEVKGPSLGRILAIVNAGLGVGAIFVNGVSIVNEVSIVGASLGRIVGAGSMVGISVVDVSLATGLGVDDVISEVIENGSVVDIPGTG